MNSNQMNQMQQTESGGAVHCETVEEPCSFCVGKHTVKVFFQADGGSLESKLASFFKSLKTV